MGFHILRTRVLHCWGTLAGPGPPGKGGTSFEYRSATVCKNCRGVEGAMMSGFQMTSMILTLCQTPPVRRCAM